MKPVIKNKSRDGKYRNIGSCEKALNYCLHELHERPQLEKTLTLANGSLSFFGVDNKNVSPEKVLIEINGNHHNLSEDGAKFFVFILNPSDAEIAAMGETDRERVANFRRYLLACLDAYARNFKRDGVRDRNDLMAFSLIHIFKGKFKKRKIEKKQMHSHSLISRLDASGHYKLSPLTNHRDTQNGMVLGGFDRDAFFQTIEDVFDQMFAYKRSVEESYAYCNAIKHGNPYQKAYQTARKDFQALEPRLRMLAETVIGNKKVCNNIKRDAAVLSYSVPPAGNLPRTLTSILASPSYDTCRQSPNKPAPVREEKKEVKVTEKETAREEKAEEMKETVKETKKPVVVKTFDDMHIIKVDGKFAYADKDLKPVSKFYKEAYPMEGLFGVVRDDRGKWNLVTRKGREALDVWMDRMKVSEGWCSFAIAQNGVNFCNAVCMADGRQISKHSRPHIGLMKDGWIVVRANGDDAPELAGKYNYLNAEGKYLLSEWAEKAESFNNGIALHTSYGVTRAVNASGESVGVVKIDGQEVAGNEKDFTHTSAPDGGLKPRPR